MLGRGMGKFGHTRLTTAWTWGKPPPPPLYTMYLSTRPTSKWHFDLKLPKLGLLRLWGPITLRVDLWLRWSLMKSYSHCWELFNGMLHATCMQKNWVESRLLVVGSQTANLTPDLSFGHNLCFKCPNGSCKPILNIYVLRAFQWYN